MSAWQNRTKTKISFGLILVCLFFAAPLRGQAQERASTDPWQERKELRAGIENCDLLIRKLETGEYVAVKLGDRLVSVSKETVIEELTLQLLAGEITSAEMRAMARLLGIWSKQRIASLKKDRQFLSEKLARLDAALGTDVSGRTRPPGKPGSSGTKITPPPSRPGSTETTTSRTTAMWAGVYEMRTGLITIRAAGNSIAATYQYKESDRKATGEWSNCQVAGDRATCNWTESYEDDDKTASRSGTLEVTLNGDTLSGSSLEDEPQFTWKRPERKGTYMSSIRKGAKWPIGATRRK